MSLHAPPYYILLATPNALVHADIEYRYADDSPLSLLSRFPDEHVLVFDYDPANPARPAISSTSRQLALSGTKVLPAPGAHVDDDASKNDNMYILEVATSTSDDQSASGVESSQTYLQNPRAIVARFKQRNADLRHILDYPSEQLSEPTPFPIAR